MLEFSKIFPFFIHSEGVKTYNEKIQSRNLLIEYDDAYPDTSEDLDFFITPSIFSKRWKVYRLYPSSITIAVGENPIDRLMLFAVKYKQPDSFLNCQVQEIDFGYLASKLRFSDLKTEEGVKKFSVSLWTGGGNFFETIPDKFYELVRTIALNLSEFTKDTIEVAEKACRGIFDALIERKSIKIPKPKPKQVTEAFDVNTKFVKSDQSGGDYIEVYLRDFIKKAPAVESVPLLIGNTGVAKSALVKSLVDEFAHEPEKENYGFRLVDFRCSFVEKMDVEGLVGISDDGEFTYNIPMDLLTRCTDDFIQYARVSYKKILERMANYKSKSTSDTSMRGFERLKEFYSEQTKTPVLFFDEVTRAQPAVQNAFTTILNQKIFQGKTMKMVRIIAATNYPVDLPEDYLDIYATNVLEDVASLDRFKPVFIVTPRVVYPRWMRFAKSKDKAGKENIHPLVTSYLEKDGTEQSILDKLYSMQDALNSISGDIQKISITPFPNFRTWEMVSKHIYAVKRKECILNEKQIINTIGEKRGQDFIEYLKKASSDLFQAPPVHLKPVHLETDDLNLAIKTCLASDVPLLMVGVSGLGKTTRVNNALKDAIVFKVNLAHTDRTSVMGAPVSVLLSERISRGAVDLLEEKNQDILIQELEVLQKQFKVPREVAHFAPRRDLYDAVQSAMESGKTLVLFFDEVNRGTPIVWSSVFEAVSDRRYGGVVFPPGLKVFIVAACNYGEAYKNVKDLDPAFAARFVVYYHPRMTPGDVENFISYMKDRKYDSKILKFFESKKGDGDYLIRMLESVESRTIEKSAASGRSFTDLDNIFESFGKETAFWGALLTDKKFPELTAFINAQNYNWDRNNLPEEIKKFHQRQISQIPSNWAAIFSGDKVTLNGKDYTAKDFLIELKGTSLDLYEKMKAGQLPKDKAGVDALFELLENLRNALFYLNSRVDIYRTEVLMSMLGKDTEFARDFIDLYNELSGTDILEVQDVVDRATAEKWVSQLLSTANTGQLSGAGIVIAKEYHNYWKNKPGSIYPEFLDVLWGYLSSNGVIASNVHDFVSFYETDKDIKQLIDNASTSLDFIEKAVSNYMQLSAVFNKDQAIEYLKRKFKSNPVSVGVISSPVSIQQPSQSKKVGRPKGSKNRTKAKP